MSVWPPLMIDFKILILKGWQNRPILYKWHVVARINILILLGFVLVLEKNNKQHHEIAVTAMLLLLERKMIMSVKHHVTILARGSGCPAASLMVTQMCRSHTWTPVRSQTRLNSLPSPLSVSLKQSPKARTPVLKQRPIFTETWKKSPNASIC